MPIDGRMISPSSSLFKYIPRFMSSLNIIAKLFVVIDCGRNLNTLSPNLTWTVAILVSTDYKAWKMAPKGPNQNYHVVPYNAQWWKRVPFFVCLRRVVLTEIDTHFRLLWNYRILQKGCYFSRCCAKLCCSKLVPFFVLYKNSLFLKKDTLFRVSVQKLTCTKRVCLFVTSFFSHNFTRHKKLVKSKNRIYSEISKKSTLLRAKGWPFSSLRKLLDS